MILGLFVIHVLWLGGGFVPILGHSSALSSLSFCDNHVFVIYTLSCVCAWNISLMDYKELQETR
jgi:hypothetical protein